MRRAASRPSKTDTRPKLRVAFALLTAQQIVERGEKLNFAELQELLKTTQSAETESDYQTLASEFFSRRQRGPEECL